MAERTFDARAARLTLGNVLTLSEDQSAVIQCRRWRTAEWVRGVVVASTGPGLPPGEDVAIGLPRIDMDAPLQAFGIWEFGRQNAAQGLPHHLPQLNLQWIVHPAGRSFLIPKLRLCAQHVATVATEFRSRRQGASVSGCHLLDHVDRRMRLLDGAMGAIGRALTAPPPRWRSILELAFRYLEYTGNNIQNFLQSAPRNLLDTFGVSGLEPLAESLLDLVAGAKCVEGIPIGETGTGPMTQSGPIALKRRLSRIRRRPGRSGPLQNKDIDNEQNLPPMKRPRHRD